MLRILVADDHAIVRQGLKQVLAEEFCHAHIEETSSGHETLLAIQEHLWDVLILDIYFPDKNGLDILKEAKSIQKSLPIVVLSLYPEEQYGIRVLKAGGSGYLTKETAPAELVSAIKKVLSGGRYVSAALAEQLAANLSPQAHSLLHQSLSDRELEVLRYLAMGKTVTDISEILGLSVKTISTYRSRLLEKLRLKTTADLIRYAVDHLLVR